MKYNEKLIEILSGLLDEFAEETIQTCPEFVESKLEKHLLTEDIARMFLYIGKHRIFLRHAKDLTNKYLIKNLVIPRYAPMVSWDLDIFLYLIIFEVTKDTIQNFNNLFLKHTKIVLNLMQYLSEEEFIIELVEIACKFYDNEYVLENILAKIVNNELLFKTYKTDVENLLENKSKANKRPPTRTWSERSYMKSKTMPQPPEVKRVKNFKHNPLPKTTFEPEDMEEKLQKARTSNKTKALGLLMEARKNAFNCAVEKPKLQIPAAEPPEKIPPVKSPPKFAQVSIKATTTSLMRQAALLAKEKEEEIKKLDDLIISGVDYNDNFENEIRQAKEQEFIQNIERKHLQGLLTREEAILAKQKLAIANQTRIQNYHEEHAKLLRELDTYKHREEEKNKALIEKAQMIERRAKEAERKLQEERRCNAKMLDFETQKLLQKAYDERQEELHKKIQLIKELKTLQQINNVSQANDFDRTETANLGLLCEMSIAELQERLSLLKRQMKEELDERKAKIVQEKRKQQELLENMKQFIVEAKTSKSKTNLTRIPKKTEDSLPDDIKELRKKLENARNTRKNFLDSCR